MDTTTSKVKEIKTVKKFQGDRGTTWYFTLEMENGDKGQVAKKTEDALKVGDALIYTLDKSGRYVKLKEPRVTNFARSCGDRKPYDNAVIALTLAKDVMVANLAAGGKTLAMNSVLCNKMTAFAEQLHEWLIAKQ